MCLLPQRQSQGLLSRLKQRLKSLRPWKPIEGVRVVRWLRLVLEQSILCFVCCLGMELPLSLSSLSSSSWMMDGVEEEWSIKLTPIYARGKIEISLYKIQSSRFFALDPSLFHSFYS